MMNGDGCGFLWLATTGLEASRRLGSARPSGARSFADGGMVTLPRYTTSLYSLYPLPPLLCDGLVDDDATGAYAFCVLFVFIWVVRMGKIEVGHEWGYSARLGLDWQWLAGLVMLAV